ncbi:MAG: CHASE2 domain-containing protein [Acidobacteria bacterium]|nr:CHASE2 domain-containing protein [Acidobacteriota bacterium]
MPERRTIGRLLYPAATVAAVAVFCLLVSFTPLFEFLNLKAYDILLQLSPRRPASQQVVTVAIDDPSIAAHGRLPWDRALIARLIERIAAARPAVIGVDLFFDLPSLPSSDQALARALERTPSVVLPVALISFPGDEDRPVRWLHPLLEFPAASLGHVNASPDADGVCRRIQLSRSVQRNRFWAFALELYRQANASALPVPQEHENFLRLGPLTVPARRDEGYEMLIHYARAPDSIPTVSAADVLSGLWDAGAATGKIVLVGVVSALEADQLFTPVSTAGQPMAGILIHGNIVNTLVERSFLIPGSLSVVLCTLLLLVAATLFLAQWGRPLWQWTGITALLIATVSGTALLFWFGGYVLPLPTFLFACLTSIAVFHVQRLGTVRNMLQHQIRRLADRLSPEPMAIDPDIVAERALTLLARQTGWEALTLRFFSGEREMLCRQAGSSPPVRLCRPPPPSAAPNQRLCQRRIPVAAGASRARGSRPTAGGRKTRQGGGTPLGRLLPRAAGTPPLSSAGGVAPMGLRPMAIARPAVDRGRVVLGSRRGGRHPGICSRRARDPGFHRRDPLPQPGRRAPTSVSPRPSLCAGLFCGAAIRGPDRTGGRRPLSCAAVRSRGDGRNALALRPLAASSPASSMRCPLLGRGNPSRRGSRHQRRDRSETARRRERGNGGPGVA